MWIIIAQIICLSAAVGLITIVYDLDHETSPFIRYGLLLLSAAFIAVFGASFRNRDVYEHAAAIAFTGVGVMVLAIVCYMIFSRHIQPIVLKVSGSILAIVLLLWLVGNLSDIKRQQLQMKDSATSTDYKQ